MRAGRRRTFVSIYRPTVTGQNASGEDTVANVFVASMWVDIQPMTGREAESARQLWAEARFRISAPHHLDEYTIQRKDIILWGSPGRWLDILDVEDVDQRRRELVIYAKDYTE